MTWWCFENAHSDVVTWQW